MNLLFNVFSQWMPVIHYVQKYDEEVGVTAGRYVPVGVIWICFLHVVLQLHQGFLLELLNLPTTVHTWVISRVKHTTVIQQNPNKRKVADEKFIHYSCYSFHLSDNIMCLFYNVFYSLD